MGNAMATSDAYELNATSWKLWLAATKVELWQAVALVLNLDPDRLRHSADGWTVTPSLVPILESSSFPSRESYQAFTQAMRQAERGAGFDGPIHLIATAAAPAVKLQEVVAYFRHADWPNIAEPLLTLLEGASKPAEGKHEREDRRLRACEDAGLKLPDAPVGRLPDGIGTLAKNEKVSRQVFSEDVRAALKRRDALRRAGTSTGKGR